MKLFEGKKVLAIGAHPDDIELHCAGTFLKYDMELLTLVMSKGGRREGDRLIEQKEAFNKLAVSKSIIGDFIDGYMRLDNDMVHFLDDVVADIKPDIIFTHNTVDFHQDHVVVARAVSAATRHKPITIFRFPQSGSAFIWKAKGVLQVDITKQLKWKNEVLDCFESQKDRVYFDTHRKSTVESFKIDNIYL